MINKLKTIAIAMMTAGATVATSYAGLTNNGDVLQPVTVTLTVYGETPATFKTASLLTAVTNALGGTNAEGAKFSKKATLDLATEVTIVATTNIGSITTNFVTNTVNFSTNTLVLSSNVYPLVATTNITGTNGGGTVTNDTISGNANFTVGNTAGSYFLTITSNAVIATATGINGPVSTTNGLTNVVLFANQTSDIGTNSAEATETNLAFGGTAVAADAATLIIESNGTPTTTVTIGTNTVTFSTNATGATVTVGTNSYTTTNAAGTTNLVLTGTNVIVSNTVASGFGGELALTNTLTTSFTVFTNTTTTSNANAGAFSTTNVVIATNVAVVTYTVDYTGTNATNISGYNTNFLTATNVAVKLVIADGGTNTSIPTAILSITNEPDNVDVDVSRPASAYTIQKLLLDTSTNAVGTNVTVASPWTLKLQGLVKSTTASVTISKTDKITVTNEAWTDVSGYGTNLATPVVLGGTISVASPSAEKQ